MEKVLVYKSSRDAKGCFNSQRYLVICFSSLDIEFRTKHLKQDEPYFTHLYGN